MEEMESSLPSPSSVGSGGLCLICCQRKSERGGGPPPEETCLSLKNLFNYLKVDVSGVVGGDFRRSDGDARILEVQVEELIAASTCEECSSLANTFGGIYEDYVLAMQLLKQCVVVLEKHLKTRLKATPDDEHGGVGGGGNTLKSEILKKCEIKLKSKLSSKPPSQVKQQFVEPEASTENKLDESQSDDLHLRDKVSSRRDYNVTSDTEGTPTWKTPVTVGGSSTVLHDDSGDIGDSHHEDATGEGNMNDDDQEDILERQGMAAVADEEVGVGKGITTPHPCGYCGISLMGPVDNVKRHMNMCSLSVQFFCQLSGMDDRDVTQAELDQTLQEIRDEGWLSEKAAPQHQYFYCTLCKETKAGSRKRHLLHLHTEVVKKRLESKGRRRRRADATNSDGDGEEESLSPLDFVSVVIKSDNDNDVVDDQGDEQPMEIQPVHRSQCSAPPGGGTVEVATKVMESGMQRRRGVAITGIFKSAFHTSREYYQRVNMKPPFTNVFLIRQAIDESPNKMLKLSEIVSWFKHSFAYFRLNDAKLNKTIRSTLSARKYFVWEDLKEGRVGAWRVVATDGELHNKPSPRVHHCIGSKGRLKPSQKGNVGGGRGEPSGTANVNAQYQNIQNNNNNQYQQKQYDHPPQQHPLQPQFSSDQQYPSQMVGNENFSFPASYHQDPAVTNFHNNYN